MVSHERNHTIQAQTFRISNFIFQTVLQMFSNQPTSDQQGTGKRISGLNNRKGQFSLAWDSGNTGLNEFQRKKQKNQDVQVKLNYQEPANYQVPKRISQGANQQGEQNKFYQLQSPYAQYAPQQPKPAPYGQYAPEPPKPSSSRNMPPAPPAPSYDEEQVLGYLRKYEHIDDMPPEELQKVMAYYQSLKEPKAQQSRPPQPPPTPPTQQMPMHAPPSQQYQQQAPVTPQDNPYQRRSSSARKPEGQNPYPAVERREPIRPRESAGGIIYGGGSVRDSNNGDKPSSSYALKKNQASIVIGDGYNYFQEEAHRKALAEQQVSQQQGQQQAYSYKPRADPSKISNIFG